MRAFLNGSDSSIGGRNHWDDAARNLERATELDPRNVKILIGVARTAELMGNYARARAARDRLIALEPNNSDGRKRRAWIDFEERGDTGALHAYYQTLDALRDTLT